MKKIAIFISCALFLGMHSSCSKKEFDRTGSISGIVTDVDNGEPIRAVSVTLNPDGLTAVTGSDGRYEFLDLPPAQYAVQAMKSEYLTNTKRITVEADKVASGDMQLTRGASKLKLDTELLNFGASLSMLSFSVMNVGTSGSISWTASTDNDWLSVLPAGGSVDAGKSNAVTATLNRDKITEDTEGIIIVSAAGESYGITVRVAAGSGGSGDEGGNNGGNNGGSANITVGLLAYYTFDNENANDATDSELHGSLINSPTFTAETVTGKGKSLFLNGTKEQYMNIPYNPFKDQKNYSISMWVKDFNVGVLFSAIYAYLNNTYDYPSLIANSDGKLVFYTGSTSSTTNSTPFSYSYKSIQDGKWHLITVVCKGGEYSSCTKQLYVDGALMDTGTGDFYYDSATKIQIGGNGDGKQSNFNSLKVDNVRFYNRALEANEVKEIYNFEK